VIKLDLILRLQSYFTPSVCNLFIVLDFQKRKNSEYFSTSLLLNSFITRYFRRENFFFILKKFESEISLVLKNTQIIRGKLKLTNNRLTCYFWCLLFFLLHIFSRKEVSPDFFMLIIYHRNKMNNMIMWFTFPYSHLLQIAL